MKGKLMSWFVMVNDWLVMKLLGILLKGRSMEGLTRDGIDCLARLRWFLISNIILYLLVFNILSYLPI